MLRIENLLHKFKGSRNQRIKYVMHKNSDLPPVDEKMKQKEEEEEKKFRNLKVFKNTNLRKSAWKGDLKVMPHRCIQHIYNQPCNCMQLR